MWFYHPFSWRVEIRVAVMRKGRQNCTLCVMATKSNNKGIVTKLYIYIFLSYYPYVLAGGGNKGMKATKGKHVTGPSPYIRTQCNTSC